ncbi:MAG: adenylate/guanylate cyclase domain-containing protein [Jaaginema sp. PMC 1079.18]|nr:adenylate/guanylate cyclase domain-containing protein [Jaaginema sp. PMC 1080.18]MEC4850759.1 adenylate/guanylate cyclase domain-containing protein [Jaaginema sp. PMC 1079.18]MEC4865339.1 adenylate/guanylate cyclase domain-containing protein [Jaaginema sp. PMC 1078.18]
MGDDTTWKQKARILVVDDIPINLRLLAKLLQDQGYEQVRLAPSGKLALESASRFEPDLILLDIMMPGLDGYQVCQALKANPQTAHIPVIFLSALSEEKDKAKGFAVGGADYITKPFHGEEVIARVRLQLQERFLRQELQTQNEKLQSEIQERRLLEQRLSTSEMKLRAMFESMQDLVFTITLEDEQIGDIDVLPTRWSCQSSSDIDWMAVIVGQFFDPEMSLPWIQQIQQVLNQQTTVNWDVCLQSAGETLWLNVDLSAWSDRSVMMVARDISTRKRNEQEIKLISAANQAIAQSSSLQDAIAAVLALVCSRISWDYGEAWQLSDTQSSLIHIADLNHCYPHCTLFTTDHPARQVQQGQDLPGYIWHTKQPYWLEIGQSPPPPGQWSDLAAQVGLKTAFGIPILAGEELLAILIFYKKQVLPCQPGLVELLRAIAIQLSAAMQRKQAEVALQQQVAETEKLLLNILPQPIALRLKAGETLIADQFAHVSVLFADIVGFTQIAARSQPQELVLTLNSIFSEFDRLALHYGLEKIKTIGDAYMVVGGLPTPKPDSPQAIAQMALAMQQVLEHTNFSDPSLQLRIGIHVGTVVAGVIGMSKFSYDLWGDTVNLASRMESSSLPGKIQVSTAAYDYLKDEFLLEARGQVLVKGKGKLSTYWLLNRLTLQD